MTILRIVRGNCTLVKRGRSLQAMGKDRNSDPMPLEQITGICVEGNVTVTAPALYQCSERGIPIHYHSAAGKYLGTFIPRENNRAKLRMFQHRAYWESRLEIAKGCVISAAKNKRVVLKRYSRKIPSCSVRLERMDRIIADAESAESVESLRGYEGAVAREYFGTLGKVFKQFSFEGRNRQPPEDEVNALISYGNMILYTEVETLLLEAGLETFCGYLHEMDGSRPSLALDLAEAFRQPIVDSVIFELVNNRRMDDRHFWKKPGICMLSTYGKHLIARSLEKKLQTTFIHRQAQEKKSYREAIRLDIYNLMKFIEGEKGTFVAFRMY